MEGSVMDDFGFYLVMTNPVVGYAKCAEAAVRAGVRMVQLRMKHASRDEIQGTVPKIENAKSGDSPHRCWWGRTCCSPPP